MTSERQAEANRQNAQKSTGPRTPAGKAVVALNGTKHGLLSRECLLKGESEAELVAFGKRLRAKLAPVGELELLLADRVVSTAWRLRRLIAVETLLFNREHSVDYAFNNSGREKWAPARPGNHLPAHVSPYNALALSRNTLRFCSSLSSNLKACCG